MTRKTRVNKNFPDLTKEKIGKLTVVQAEGSNKYKQRTWRCQCDCGNIVFKTTWELRTSECAKHCGCAVKDQAKAHMEKLKLKLIGKVFGRLTVISLSPKSEEMGRHYWLCQCSCGNKPTVGGWRLIANSVRSCGCLKTDSTRALDPSGAPAYKKYMRMYMRNAQVAKRTFSLTYDQFVSLIKQSCHFCGAPPTRIISRRSVRGDLTYTNIVVNGIDRKDNLIGYEIENVVPCCTRCNRSKLTATYAEFVSYLDQLVAYRTQGPINL